MFEVGSPCHGPRQGFFKVGTWVATHSSWQKDMTGRQQECSNPHRNASQMVTPPIRPVLCICMHVWACKLTGQTWGKLSAVVCPLSKSQHRIVCHIDHSRWEEWTLNVNLVQMTLWLSSKQRQVLAWMIGLVAFLLAEPERFRGN